MSAFRTGWYEVSFDASTRDRCCRYFKNQSAYTAECLVKSTGQQILLWYDPAGVTGPGKAATWQPTYRPLENAPKDDWWDNAPGGKSYSPELPDSGSRAQRELTLSELCGRAGTADIEGKQSLSCSREIHVGLFFDGTNNNMKRDMPLKSHSNVVALFNAHRNDQTENFAFYIPGVGTEFKEIGESAETDAGKAYAAGGEARIHWGMLQVLNAVSLASIGSEASTEGGGSGLLTESEMKQLVTSTSGLATWWRISDDKMIHVFADLQKKLLTKIESARPRITTVHLSVFGFSRGAAEARTCCQWIRKATKMKVGYATLNMRFLGIFDTVASVGLADSSPVGCGFMDWADGTMDIGKFEKVAHFVAAHEIRQSFPLSTARIGAKHYPENTKEYIYPGAHSDVGGGYGPGSQGKSVGGRAELLSQIPLNDMYVEACNAGVRLLPKGEMQADVRADFEIAPSLDKAFAAYAGWTETSEKENVAEGKQHLCENRMQYHTHLYWRWRAHVSDDRTFKAMFSYNNSDAQDQTDLWESELDWRKDVARAKAAANQPRVVSTGRHGSADVVELPPAPTELQKQIVTEVNAAATVPALASDFFDRYVHDSHGGFWLLGPITAAQRTAFITDIKAKKARHDRLLRDADATPDPDRSDSLRRIAQGYALNGFERRVLAKDAESPGTVPLMTDADAADLRANAGTATSVAMWVLGTETRREPHGHGRYRRVFDQS